MVSKPLKTVKNVKKYKTIISTQNFKENPKILVETTAVLKEAIQNVKNVKNTCLLRILMRIQKERLLHDITIKL